MKKVILMMLVAVLGVATANAQFLKGGKTLSGSLTGFDFGITNIDGVDDSRINVDLGINGSYFVIDNLAITAGVGLNSYKFGDFDGTGFDFTVGARYYFWQALYGGLAYIGEKSPSEGSDFLSAGKIEVGYDYYITDNVFFEPAIFFKQGFGDKNKVNTFGLSIGIGVNF
ncbi:MAG: hypothetical protein LBO74_06280 [Candidatus Symbiothrix sp.]|jgi:hypothetical protein|nr:hypothetical protein [Candidatus Symbiothrix sp.]